MSAIILYDSPEAARLETREVWVDRHGTVMPDERAARWSSCTHVRCKTCATPTEKTGLYCAQCIARRHKEQFDAMPRLAWDGEAMLYSLTQDQYYSDVQDAIEAADTAGITLADMRLVICEPVCCRELDLEYFSDQLPDDGDPPQQLEACIAAFNKAVAGDVLSWTPGAYALELPEEQP